jgi:hypothetical protein
MIDMTFSLKVDGIELNAGMVDTIFKEAGGKFVSQDGHDVKYMVEKDQRDTIKKKLGVLFGETQRATKQTTVDRERLDREAKIAKSETLTATAYHEAGHAVIGWAVGRGEIKEVSINPNKRTHGRVRFKKTAPLKEKDQWGQRMRIAVTSAAGFVAQDRHCKTDNDPYINAAFLGGHGDMVQFMKVADLHFLKERKIKHYPRYGTPRYWAMRHDTYFTMKDVEATARKYVDKYWPAIERVAQVLLSVKVIKGHDQLVAIINEAL